ncbi:NTP transferase domain-containing protein [Lacisediminihabitans sp. H27-G8]|uniref:NTP transferase domain-containing protein n=1 Tax=Lacisediminihabitans sp. H27-G8 TaxID=3111909 RepID=UPI0038FC6F7E
MIFDAIVLAGGRASRLDGVSKPELEVDGRSLLSRALDAASGARHSVVVGTPSVVPAGVLVTREDPAYGGPAAAIGAGILALGPESPGPESRRAASPDYLLVLASDLPNSAKAVAELLTHASEGTDGVLAIDSGGRRQPLLGLYRYGPLSAAVHGRDLTGLSVRALLASLDLAEIPMPEGSTDDIDTWADAAGFGIPQPAATARPTTTKGQPMSDRDDEAMRVALSEWSDRLTEALGLEAVDVDIDAVLALAGTAAHAVLRPAAPLTTYLVGYAAGIAAASTGPAGATAAFGQAVAIATQLAKSEKR